MQALFKVGLITATDPFHLNLSGSRGNASAGLQAERIAVFP